jgi:hypothetical protein
MTLKTNKKGKVIKIIIAKSFEKNKFHHPIKED